MRSRILWVAITSVILAVTVLGLPLALAVSHIVANDERSELEQLALRAAVAVSPDYRTGDPVELPESEPGVDLAVYDPQGRHVTGSGPLRLEAQSQAAASGSVAQFDGNEQLVVVVPVSRGEHVIAMVRAASPESAVNARTLRWDSAVLGGCVLAAVCAAGFAARQSRLLARPLERLARTAAGLGAGDLTVRTEPSGVVEIDAVGDSLNHTAERLSELIERERSFATDASHQLRTPLTQLQLELEQGLERGGESLRSAATAAMTTADQLSQTIDDVLGLARRSDPVASFDVDVLLDQLESVWHGPLAAQDRPLRVGSSENLQAAASMSAARQVLYVLLDNALRHGRGTVTVHARDSHGAVAIDVVDQGNPGPISLTGQARLGLSLAQSLAKTEGGRLLLDQRESETRFTLLLRTARRSD